MGHEREGILIVVGLTGGIATGKSTVSAILKHAGSEIIDADRIAREVVKKGLPAWEKIVETFGHEILGPYEEIHRSYLADIVFNDPDKKQLLNAIVHPYVIEETDRKMNELRSQNPGAVCVLDVPLLIEAGMNKGLSEVIVVYIPETLQLLRLMKRDNLSDDQALSRVRSQMPIEEKKALATIVIDNSFSLESTKKSTLKVYQYLVEKVKGK